MPDELCGAKTHDDGHTPCSNLRPHRARRPPHNAMCKNLKMGTVMGKTQACAISTVAWFFGGKRVPQTATRVEQVSEWITMWRGFNVVWEKEAPILTKDPQTLEPSCRPNLCHHLVGVGGGLEAEYTRFLVSARRQCFSGWRFVQQGADHRQFLQGYGYANMEKCDWAFAQFGHGERDPHRLCQESLIKEGYFMAACALDFLVCGAINEPRLPTDGSSPNQFFCVRCDFGTLSTRKHELWERPGID